MILETGFKLKYLHREEMVKNGKEGSFCVFSNRILSYNN